MAEEQNRDRNTTQAEMLDHPAKNLGIRTGNLVDRNGPKDKLTQNSNDSKPAATLVTQAVVELAGVPDHN